MIGREQAVVLAVPTEPVNSGFLPASCITISAATLGLGIAVATFHGGNGLAVLMTADQADQMSGLLAVMAAELRQAGEGAADAADIALARITARGTA